MQMLGKDPAERRPGNRGGDEDRREIGLIAAALARGDDVADNRLAEREEAAAAKSLQGAGADQDEDVARYRAGDGAAEEDGDGEKEHCPSPMHVAELAVERCRRRRREEVSGDHPGQVLHIIELAPDRRQRGRNDRLVEGAQEHRQHHADHDRANLGMVEKRRGGSGPDRLVHVE